jgi:hypothetical protein
MNRRLAVALAAASVAATTSSAPAIDFGLGLFKKKKPPEAQAAPAKADPSTRIKQLVATVQSDPDTDRRKAAVGELQGYDPRTSPEVLSALVGSLQKDPSPDIRAKAAETLGGFRTVYTSAAAALESAESSDPDRGVRAAAKSALWQYGLNGYKTSAGNASNQTAEPPLAKPVSRPTAPPSVSAKVPVNGTDTAFRPITQGPAGKVTPYQQSAEPPLAKTGTPVSPPTSPVTAAPPPGVPQRMPTRIDTPVNPPKLDVPAPSLPDEKKTVTPPKSAEPPAANFPLPLPNVPTVPLQMPTTPPTVAPPGK